MSVYISEFNAFSANGGDFVEVAAPAGMDMSDYSIYVYNNSGYVIGGPYSFGPSETTVAGNDVYVLDEHGDGFSLSNSHSLALVNNGSVVQFLADDDYVTTAVDGPIAGATSTGSGDWGSSHSQQSDDGGATYYDQSTLNKGIIPCFAAGTLIQTEAGVKPIETLVPGDAVVTETGASASIVWVNASPVSLDRSKTGELPIVIKSGALGPNLPLVDLVVSPNHRILVGGRGQLEDIFQRPVFVPAKSLTDLPKIRVMLGRDHIVWHHFACASHHVVSANGCATESLLLGPMVLTGFDAEMFGAVMSINWPGNDDDMSLNGPPCLPCLSPRAARNTIHRGKCANAA